MAITILGPSYWNSAANAGATSGTLTLPETPQADDLVFFGASNYQWRLVTPSGAGAAWTMIDEWQVAGAPASGSVWWRGDGATDTSLSWTAPDTIYGEVWAFIVRGAAPGVALDVHRAPLPPSFAVPAGAGAAVLALINLTGEDATVPALTDKVPSTWSSVGPLRRGDGGFLGGADGAAWVVPGSSGDVGFALSSYMGDSNAVHVLVIGGDSTPPDPAPDPVIPEPEAFVPEVIVGGVVADVDSVRISSDSPAHFGIPPRGSHIAGAEADLDWEWSTDVSTQAEHSFAGTFRPTPGATTTIDVPGPDGVPFRAFTGIIDTTSVSLGMVPLRSSCVDPLVDTNAVFSAPALTSTMPNVGAHTTTTRLFVDAQSIWYAERALDAIGARSTVPQTPLTVWHQSMCGSTWPAVGTLTTAGQWDGAGYEADHPEFNDFSDDTERIGCVNPYTIGVTRPWGGSASAPWTLSHELDPAGAAPNYRVRVQAAGSSVGFCVRVTAATGIEVRTIDSGGAETTVHTIPRAGSTRILVKYDPSSGALAAVVDAAPATVYTATVGSLSLSASGGRVAISGSGAVGAVSVYRDGPAIADDPNLLWPRRAAFRLPPSNQELWRLHVHPPIVSEPAVRWLTERAHAEQALLWTDHIGVTHWADVRGFDDQDVIGEITDAVVTGGDTPDLVGLDELSYVVRRQAPYRRVRVTGKRGSTTYSYRANAHRMAAHAPETVQIEAGDPPVQLWLKPLDGYFWFGPLDTSMRIAGGAWGKDFERGYGSFYGGHVVDAAGDPIRWASASDISVTVDEVGFDTALVTLTPGASLAAGETFVNLPLPTSPGLENYPEVRNRALPVLTAWAVTPTIEIHGVSTDINSSNFPEYEHDAGWSAGFLSGPRTPTVAAQAIADRQTEHIGEIQLECEAAPVRIGQRWHVRVGSVADLLFDVVVLGSEIAASAGQSRMTLRAWAMSVVAPEPVDPDPEPTEDTTAPSVPASLTATATGETTAALSWSASTDNVAVAGYEYRVDGGSAVDVGLLLNANPSGLTSATEYDFEVRAYDAAGNYSEWSAVATATTDAPPFSPTALSGKVLWLRADDLTAGTTPAPWPDQSGNSSDATHVGSGTTVVAAATPSGGQVVRYNGSGRHTLPNIIPALPDGAEAWVVVKSSAPTTTYRGLHRLGSSSQLSHYPSATTEPGIFETPFSSSRPARITPTVAVDAWRLYRVRHVRTGAWTVWLDGVQQATGTGLTFSPAPAPAVGANAASGGSTFVGDVAEVLWMGRLLTAGEAADLISYFNETHGLSVPGGSA